MTHKTVVAVRRRLLATAPSVAATAVDAVLVLQLGAVLPGAVALAARDEVVCVREDGAVFKDKGTVGGHAAEVV